MDELSIEVTGLKKYFVGAKAVDGISFKVKAGSIYGMLGPNGAGKTTTIETLVGLYRRDGGRISVLGYDPEDDLDKIKKLIGVQLQSPSLFPRLTVEEMVNLFSSFYPQPMDPVEVINKVGLDNKENTQIRFLSGGQRHRLAVGLAMVSNGKIMFLDEPTTGLDPKARRQLWDVIKGLKNNGVTVFLTTHYMEEAEKLCDDLMIIDLGKVIVQGSPRELIKEFSQETAIEFSDPGLTDLSRKALEDLQLAARVSYEVKEKRIILYTHDVPFTMKKLLDFGSDHKLAIDDIMVRRASLEDVFLKLTGRGIRE